MGREGSYFVTGMFVYIGGLFGVCALGGFVLVQDYVGLLLSDSVGSSELMMEGFRLWVGLRSGAGLSMVGMVVCVLSDVCRGMGCRCGLWW